MKARNLISLLAVGVIAAGCHRNAGTTEAVAAPETGATPVPAVPAPFATPVRTGMPDVAALVDKVKPAVVNITSEHDVDVPDMNFPFGFSPFGGLFGRGEREHPEEQRHLKQRALGSGFLIDSAGHVVTNEHVVDGADRVRVKLADDREFMAKVKGRDERLDLAVLEIEGAKDLPVASLGSSESLRVGESVVAIGNPFGLGHTVTMGIVSGKGRAIGAGPYDDFIQTDASINPGNSGGPLFDLRGQVVGINTAINPNGKGIGFAIPVDALKDVLPQLLESGHIARGRLGVLIQPVDAALAKAVGLDAPKGAMIDEVESGGPGEKAGLQPGDIITKVDSVDVKSSQELPRLIARHAPGTTVKLHVLHDRKEKTIDVKLEALGAGTPRDTSRSRR